MDRSAGYRVEQPNGQTLRIGAYVESLFDERYETFSESNAFGGLQQVGKPRILGVALSRAF